MISRVLELLSFSRHPVVASARDYVKRHKLLLEVVRALLSCVRTFLAASRDLQEYLWPPIAPNLQAILDARAIGGALSVSDLEMLWDAGKARPRALCLGGVPELEQIKLILERAGAASIVLWPTAETSPGEAPDATGFDLIVVAPVEEQLRIVDQLQRGLSRTQIFLKVGEDLLRRGAYVGVTFGRAWSETSVSRASRSLREKLDNQERLKIVLLNDVGFQYGAGIALKRQAASFLLKGWDVSVVAWSPGPKVGQPPITGVRDLGNWHGIHGLRNVHERNGWRQDQITAEVGSKILSLDPDVVLVGNIHGAGWPIGLLSYLRERGRHVVAYMHDCYWVTGRCAYSGPCTKFRTGCDASCPTPDEHPRLAPEKIAQAWKERANLFAGPAAIPLIANSHWTFDIASQRFGSAARTGVVHLGVDHELFSPIAKTTARRLLDLPQEKIIVVMGAVDVRDPRKGGALFEFVRESLSQRDDLGLVLFGQSSKRLTSARSFGLVRDERLMPFILSAADIFVGTAKEEAFGQTLLEASACALPVVALDVGGVGDIIEDRHSGILVPLSSSQDLLTAVDRLVADPVLRRTLGQNGRAKVEQHFTLARQADAWVDCLKRLC